MRVTHNTFVIERAYATTPERVFRAFADPERKRRWFADGEHHDVEEFEIDFRVGGNERAKYRFKEGTPFPGMQFVNEGSYQDIVPNERIVMASTMTMGDRRISASLMTVELTAAGKGTNMIFTHQGVFLEGSDGPERREAGWQKLIERLGSEVAR